MHSMQGHELSCSHRSPTNHHRDKGGTNGLAVLPGELLPALLSGASLVGELLDDSDADRVRLTPRELEVRCCDGRRRL